MKKTLVKSDATMSEVKDYLEKNNYRTDDVTVGEFALYAEGCQDADFFELEENDGLYNLYVC
jgi:hypothetical protein